MGWLCLTNLSCSYGLQLFLRLCAMSADLKGAVLRKLGDEPRWAGLRFRRELPLWLTEISAVPAYNPNFGEDRLLDWLLICMIRVLAFWLRSA